MNAILEFLKTWVDSITKVTGIILGIISIVTFFKTNLFEDFVLKLIIRYKKSKIMSLHEKSCQLLCKQRTGLINENITDITQSTGVENFYNADEVYAFINLQKTAIQNSRNTKFELINSSDDLSDRSDQILLGGPLSNEYVNSMFEAENPFSTVKRFKGHFSFVFDDNKYDENRETYEESTCVISKKTVTEGNHPEINELKDQCTYALSFDDNNKTLIPFQINKSSGIIVLAKICRKSYPVKKHGTVHICFGYSANDTRLAARVYSDYYSELYKKLKEAKHLKQYFIVIRVIENQIDFEHYYDMTEYMFNGKN